MKKGLVQRVFWDRGRPARNERAARKTSYGLHLKDNLACGALRAGRPRSQQIAARNPGLHTRQFKEFVDLPSVAHSSADRRN